MRGMQAARHPAGARPPPAPHPRLCLRPPLPLGRSYTNIVGLQGGINGFLRVFDTRLNPKGALLCCVALLYAAVHGLHLCPPVLLCAGMPHLAPMPCLTGSSHRFLTPAADGRPVARRSMKKLL